MENCIFCKIIAGKIPSHKVYEDDFGLAFLDIHPTTKGHTLVLPKKHVPNLEEIEENDLCLLIKTVKKVGHLLNKGLKVQGYNLIENNNPVSGQIIPHIHFHLIPRREGDGLRLWGQGNYAPGEAEEIIKRLRGRLLR